MHNSALVQSKIAGSSVLSKHLHQHDESFCQFDQFDSTLWLFILPERCPYSEFYWSIFVRNRTEHGEIRSRKTPNTNTFYGVFVMWLRWSDQYCTVHLFLTDVNVSVLFRSSSERHSRLRSVTLLKKTLYHRIFPVDFAEFLRTPLVTETSLVPASINEYSVKSSVLIYKRTIY